MCVGVFWIVRGCGTRGLLPKRRHTPTRLCHHAGIWHRWLDRPRGYENNFERLYKYIWLWWTLKYHLIISIYLVCCFQRTVVIWGQPTCGWRVWRPWHPPRPSHHGRVLTGRRSWPATAAHVAKAASIWGFMPRKRWSHNNNDKNYSF